MNYFELGFLSEAQEKGYSRSVSEAFLKRASEIPGVAQILQKHPEVDESEPTSFTPEALLEKFKQDFIQKDLNNQKIKINL